MLKFEEMCVSNQNEIVLKNSKLIFSSESIAGALILLWLPGFGLKTVANALFYLFKVGRAASEEWRQSSMRLDGVQHSESLGRRFSRKFQSLERIGIIEFFFNSDSHCTFSTISQ